MNDTKSDAALHGRNRPIYGRLELGIRRQQQAGGAPVATAIARGLYHLIRVKLLLSRLLLRGYIRIGATVYRRSAGALVVRRDQDVIVRESELLVAQRRLQRFVSRVLLTKLGFAIVALAATFSYTNPYTPPGYEGYVYEQPRILGAGGFKGTQVGPANFGISFWRNKVLNVDVRPDTHVEELKALTSDDLAVSMRFSAVLWIRSGNVAQVVNDFGGKDWYARFVRPRLRSLVQDAVQRRAGFEIKAEGGSVESDVRRGLEAYLRETPFALRDLSITDMAYPEKIAQAVQHKLEAQQLLEEKKTLLAIAQRNAEIEVVEAQGHAEAQRIVGSTLTPMFLQHEAIQAEVKGAESPSHTTVYIPTGASGIPLVGGPVGSPRP